MRGRRTLQGAPPTPTPPLFPPALQRPRCVADVTVRPESAVAKAKGPAFDFGLYMKDRAVLIDAALDKSVPLQYPEVINEAMRYSLLAGVRKLEQLWVPAAPRAAAGSRTGRA